MPLPDSIEAPNTLSHSALRRGNRPAAVLATGGGREVFTVEGCMLAGHQKEAVDEGDAGSRWRLVSDEGRHLKGTDLAPFPLGYFNADLQGDLHGRIAAMASQRNIQLDELRVGIRNFYWMAGCFTRGDGQLHPVPESL